MKKSTTLNFFGVLWDRLPLIIRAVITGSLVSGLGVGVWNVLFSSLRSAWAILPMTGCLWVYCKYFSGSWLPKNNTSFRRENFRATRLQPAVWKWGLIAAALFVVIVQASFVVTFRLLDFPAAKFTADYKIVDSFPLWQAWLIIIMSSIVAAICEEAGLRGYMQQPLEKRYGPIIAIVITSVAFTATHLGHTWAAPILPHIFFASVLLGILCYRTGSLIPGILGHAILDIFDYSIWWTDITGGFTKQTIFKTGIDLHFVIWAMLFLLAFFGFIKAIGRLKGVVRQEPLQFAIDEVSYAR